MKCSKHKRYNSKCEICNNIKRIKDIRKIIEKSMPNFDLDFIVIKVDKRPVTVGKITFIPADFTDFYFHVAKKKGFKFVTHLADNSYINVLVFEKIEKEGE